MPRPNPTETQDEFIERCIPIVLRDGTAGNDSQAVAVCQSMWEQEMEDKTAVSSVWSESGINSSDTTTTTGVISVSSNADSTTWIYTPNDETTGGSRYNVPTKEQIKFDLEAPCRSKAIKILDSDKRRIGAYASVWGEEDCERDRMMREAIQPYIGKSAPLMLWLHGLDPDFGTNTPGTWDGASFKADDKGLWVEGNITHDHYGNEAWSRINKAGVYGLSVGSAWYLVKREDNGDGTKNITDWPLLEISIMEGGKQCVPSAQRELRADLEAVYSKAAKSIGIKLPAQGNQHNGGKHKMTDNVEEATLDIEKLVADKVDAVIAAKEEAERLAKERQAEVDNAVKAGVDKALEEAEKKYTEKVEEFEAELEKAKKEAKAQPAAPAVAQGGDAVRIEVSSPYDRLSTMDLAIRYELLKSWGKPPSTKMWRALALRVGDLAQTEDVVGIKHGQPVKAPAIDWSVIVPSNLDLNEVEVEVKGRQPNMDMATDVVTPQGVKQMAELALKANELVHSTQSGYGDSWVPTLASSELWRTIRLNAAVLPLFTQFDMPSQPYDYPTESTDPTFYKAGETTNEAQLSLTSAGPITKSKVATAKVTFSAGKLAGLTVWSEEMEEDSIIPTEPQIRDQYGLKMAHELDYLLISGDETTATTNISDNGATSTTASRLVLDGLRHEALVTTTADSRDAGALTVDDFGNTQALMGTAGKFGVNPNDLAFIMDPAVWHKAKLLSEVLTVDKFGAGATIVTGQLGGLFGSPLIVSEDYGLTDASGNIHNTAGNNTKGSFFCVNRRMVMVGWRRRPRIRVVGLPGMEARYIVATARLDVGYKEAGSVGLSYNITV